VGKERDGKGKGKEDKGNGERQEKRRGKDKDRGRKGKEKMGRTGKGAGKRRLVRKPPKTAIFTDF